MEGNFDPGTMIPWVILSWVLLIIIVLVSLRRAKVRRQAEARAQRRASRRETFIFLAQEEEEANIEKLKAEGPQPSPLSQSPKRPEGY